MVAGSKDQEKRDPKTVPNFRESEPNLHAVCIIVAAGLDKNPA
jgi:hypothetical protein